MGGGRGQWAAAAAATAVLCCGDGRKCHATTTTATTTMARLTFPLNKFLYLPISGVPHTNIMMARDISSHNLRRNRGTI